MFYRLNLNKLIKAGLAAVFLTLALFFTAAAPANAQAALLSKPQGLHSHHAYAAIDAYSGQVLVGEDQNKVVYPASTTKLMTAIVILEEMKRQGMGLDTKVTVQSPILRRVESSLTSYGLRSGETYTMRTLLNMILICSYGDATYVAADKVFGSTAGCVAAMNAKVKSLGLTKTHFDNVTGLDIGNGYTKNYTTATEMAMITRCAMNNKTIAGIVAKAYFQVYQANGRAGRRITSTNMFYHSISYDRSLFKIIGSKTGTTSAAGYVFAATAIDDAGHKVISVYMGNYSTYARFTDTNLVLRRVFTAVKNKEIPLRTQTTYPVYFKGNGSTSGSMNWTTCTYDKKSALPANKFKRTNYVFAGWNTKKDGSGISIPVGGTAKNLIAKDEAYAVLYAQWKPIEYPITYRLDGGTNSSKNPSAYNSKMKVVLADPKKTGYTFQGWFTDSSRAPEYQVTRIAYGSKGAKKFYAKWKANKYYVRFNGNGCLGPDGEEYYSQAFRYDKSAVLKANRFVREGYKFLGWNTKEDGSGITYKNKTQVLNLTSRKAGLVKVYAQWKRIEPEEPETSEEPESSEEPETPEESETSTELETPEEPETEPETDLNETETEPETAEEPEIEPETSETDETETTAGEN